MYVVYIETYHWHSFFPKNEITATLLISCVGQDARKNSTLTESAAITIVGHINGNINLSCLYKLTRSIDDLFKQFESRRGPTKHGASSEIQII